MVLLGEHWFSAVSEAVRERGLEVGQTLFRQGEPVFGIFAVITGRLRMTRHTMEGKEVIVHVARAGETFAEPALFSDIYHCDAVADTASRVAILPKDAVLRSFDADPAVGRAFMARLAKQVQSLRSRLEIRNIRSAPERVHQFLVLNSRGERNEVLLDGPLKDAAAEIGLTHEAFYRALTTLVQQGRINRQGRLISLLYRRA